MRTFNAALFALAVSACAVEDEGFDDFIDYEALENADGKSDGWTASVYKWLFETERLTKEQMNRLPHGLPGLGDLDGNQFNHRGMFVGSAAELNSSKCRNGNCVFAPEFGISTGASSIAEIPVASPTIPRSPFAAIGKLVKSELFQKDNNGVPYGDFIFNVSFGAGNTGYADPGSIWNNVFYGYYEVDVPASWNRPFGYNADGSPKFEDVLRLAKADWNFFSNYAYGVPLDKVRLQSGIDMNAQQIKLVAREKIGNTYWDVVTLDGMVVVSPNTPDDNMLKTNSVLTPLFRASFGAAPGRAPLLTREQAFHGVKMKGVLVMAHQRVDHDKDIGGPAYHTYIFGGSVREDYWDTAARDRFLSTQVTLVKGLISKFYPNLGFAQ